MHSIEMASKYVSSKVRAAGLLSLYGEEGSVNVQVRLSLVLHSLTSDTGSQGEVVKKVDVLANEAFISNSSSTYLPSLSAI
jgi:fructose-1,6-bisphosphatase